MRDRWLAAPRRGATQRTTGRFGPGLAALVTVLIVLAHLSILAARRADPPRLAKDALFRTIGLFCGGAAARVIATSSRLRRPW